MMPDLLKANSVLSPQKVISAFFSSTRSVAMPFCGKMAVWSRDGCAIFFDCEVHRGFSLWGFSEAARRKFHPGHGMNHKEATQGRNDSKGNNHEKNSLPRSSCYDLVPVRLPARSEESGLKCPPIEKSPLLTVSRAELEVKVTR